MDRSSSGQSGVPPSRHLWVGNLSHSISEGDLVRPFLRFGELESVAFQPGRSYAFVNFKIEEGAIAALKALQGFPLAGSPLRIEFAKVVSLAPNLCYSFNFKHLVVWSYLSMTVYFNLCFSINQMVSLPEDHYVSQYLSQVLIKNLSRQYHHNQTASLKSNMLT